MQNADEAIELISAIVLDADIVKIAAADAIAIAAETSADQIQTLSIARAEAWRQLRARNIFPYDERLIQAGSDPVGALTLIERTALALVGRLGLSDQDAGRVLGMKTKIFRKTFLKAKMNLVRMATAISLVSMESRCPAVVSGKRKFGVAFDRRTAMHFVVHAGECSICVTVLREIDHTIWQDYQAAPKADYEIAATVDVAALIPRAGLTNGFAEPLPEDFRDQSRSVRKAALLAAGSSVLLGLAWLLSRF